MYYNSIGSIESAFAPTKDCSKKVDLAEKVALHMLSFFKNMQATSHVKTRKFCKLKTHDIAILDDLPAGFPAIDAHPMLKSVERGRTAQVTCQARGEPRPKVMWLRDLMPVDIRANSRYTVSTLGNPGQ